METLKNTYKKYCPNVYVAKCPEQHEKGSVISLVTRYGKENLHEVFNLVGKTADGCFLYSIVRADGFNTQERAKRKAEKLSGYAHNAIKRSNEAYKRSDLSESATGIPFGQPILVGHHSEKRHRRTIEKAHRAMDKCLEESKKAEEHESRSKYWKNKANEINLSMPESIEFFKFKLEEAKKTHKYYKENPDKREHSYSLTYAKKEVNELTKKVNTAIILWGNEEEIKEHNESKKKDVKQATKKSSKNVDLIKKHGGFFAFNNEQLLKGYNKLLEDGKIEKGEKVTHFKAGLLIPSKNVDNFIAEL